MAAPVPLHSARAGAVPTLIREPTASSTLPDKSTAASRSKILKECQQADGTQLLPGFLGAVVSCNGQEPQPNHSHNSTTWGSGMARGKNHHNTRALKQYGDSLLLQLQSGPLL